MNENEDLFLLTDEDGKEIPCELLDAVFYNGGDYVVLLPVPEEGDPESEEVVILKKGVEDGEEVFLSVDDGEISDAVFGIFAERNKDKYDFTA